MAKKTKPSSPEEIARKAAERRRKDFEAVGLSPEMADLVNNAPIEPTRAGDQREGQTVKEDSARRLDAFAALKAGMQAGCFDAVRRYEQQLLTRRGENDRGPASERVDRTAGLTTDRMLDAAKWLCAVNDRLPPRDLWMLVELLSPTIERTSWREVVSYITGEMHDHAQGAAVRSMTVNLRDAIETHDRGDPCRIRRAA